MGLYLCFGQADVEARSRARPSKAAAARLKARALVKDGIKEFKSRYYRRAIKLFNRALTLVRDPTIHPHIALAYKWLGNNIQALRHYERFLKQFPARPKKAKDRALRARVQRQVTSLRRFVAFLTLRASGPPAAELRVNGALVGRSPVTKTLDLVAGTHTVTASLRGYRPFLKKVRIGYGQRVVVVVVMSRRPVKKARNP